MTKRIKLKDVETNIVRNMLEGLADDFDKPLTEEDVEQLAHKIVDGESIVNTKLETIRSLNSKVNERSFFSRKISEKADE